MHMTAVYREFGATVSDGAPMTEADLDVCKNVITHKLLVLAIVLFCFSGLRRHRALMRASKNTIAAYKTLVAECKAAWFDVLSKRVRSAASPEIPALQIIIPPPAKQIWEKLYTTLGVKTRLPQWIMHAMPRPAEVYKMCLQRPLQLTDGYMKRLGVQETDWRNGLDKNLMRDWLKQTSLCTKAIFYLLAHADHCRRSLAITLCSYTPTACRATVCTQCYTVRTQAHSHSTIKSKRTGIMLDVRQQLARCADCQSVRLARVPAANRIVASLSGKQTMTSAACGGCGQLCNMTAVRGSSPWCKRCKESQDVLPCFCRAPSKCTVAMFLTVHDGALVLQGVCARHVAFVPSSIELLEVVARRANVRI